ncbi:MAG: hypothetical protein ACJZ12_05055 [Candidatus Neomarinimicrobiota bacterium]
MIKTIMIFLISFSFGQNYDKDDERDQAEYDFHRPDKIENMVIWRLTEDLDLSSEQAEKFFPRFREHREELEEISKDERGVLTDVRLKIRDEEELSRSEMEKTIKIVSELRKKRIDLESKFILEMDDILTPNQMVKLSVFKQRLMKELQGEMRGRKDKNRKKKDRRNKKRGGFFRQKF